MIPTSLIPISDVDSPHQRFHFVVLLLIMANIAVFIYEMRLGDLELLRFVYQYGAIPYELTRFTDLDPQIPYPVWITAFTSMFIHGGLLHLGSNLLFLWIFGDNIEDALGRLAFLLFYFVCGLGALATQILIDPGSTTPVIGASGAIAGVLGAYLILFPRGRVNVVAFIVVIPLLFRLPAVVVIGMWILTQILAGYVSLGPTADAADGGIAYFAHIGGFVTGIFLILLLRRR